MLHYQPSLKNTALHDGTPVSARLLLYASHDPYIRLTETTRHPLALVPFVFG